MLVYIADFGTEQWVESLKDLSSRASPRLHQLADSPEEADLILCSGGWSSDYYRGIISSPSVRRFPEKCFIYSDNDLFLPLLPGAYTSAKNGMLSRGRIAGAAYIASHSTLINPYVEPKRGEKQFLFSFMGGATSRLRKRLFRTAFNDPAIWIENTTSLYHHWADDLPNRSALQKRYVDTIAQSHFAICPRGAGRGSIRLFEVMAIGVAPVIISDGLILPRGPNWETCSLRVPEGDIGRLPELLRDQSHRSAELGRAARIEWEKHFAPDKIFNNIIDSCEWISRNRIYPEKWFRLVRPLVRTAVRTRWETRQYLRGIALRILKK
jgi:hypothetical protein